MENISSSFSNLKLGSSNNNYYSINHDMERFHQQQQEKEIKEEFYVKRCMILELSQVLIKEILSFENNLSILDYICFSLTCRKFFNERDKYLLFNPRHLVVRSNIVDEIPTFSLHSYKNIFEKSLLFKDLCDLFLLQDETHLKKKITSKKDIFKYDYIECVNNQLKINDRVTCLYLDDPFEFDLNNVNVLNSSNIKKMVLSIDYNYPIIHGSLPKGLELLEFGDSYNQPIDVGALDNGCLETVKFGYNYKQVFVPGSLPESLTYLKVLNDDHNDVLLAQPGAIPSKLKAIKLNMFNIDFGLLPPTLTSLHIGEEYTYDQQSVSLNHLVNLTVLRGFPIEMLHLIPPTVTRLSLSSDDQFVRLEPGQLPDSVTDLNFLYIQGMRLSIGSIGSNVTRLNLGCYFKDQLRPGVIPTSVRYLNLGQIYNTKLAPGDIPEGVETLIMSECFNQKIEKDTLPSTIISLSFGYFLEQLHPNTIPKSVLHLKFWEYAYQFEENVLPPFLKTLEITTLKFPHSFKQNTLPSTLELLNVRGLSGPIETDAVVQPNIYSNNNITNGFHNENIGLSRLEIHVNRNFIKNGYLDLLPPNVFSIEFKLHQKNFTLRRIEKDVYIGNHAFLGGFISINKLLHLIKNYPI